MSVLLAGDIGGTKTILRLVRQEADGTWSTLDEQKFISGEFPSLTPLVQRFLSQAQPHSGTSTPPQRACFAIAGPIVDQKAQLTNLPWQVEAEALSQELGIERVALINDFSAVGYGVLVLPPQDVLTLQTGERLAEGPIAVIGAGTGLGEAYLVSHEGRYQVFPSEGGHVDFAPRSQEEWDLVCYLLERNPEWGRVSLERVVSGMGIVSLYKFFRDTGRGEAIAAVESALQKGSHEMEAPDPAAQISQAADAGERTAQQVLDLFISAYGTAAGNLALKFLPDGGLYVAGGIAPKLAGRLQAGGFMKAFLDKGRLGKRLQSIPVQVVMNAQVGLIGAAAYAADL
ncbi:MAG: glucokinase [Synechococcaceae cyanobacterium SM2_3_1]|nr:glucokinase [Synechococcaceae cyanobacterium SM2_3_1]